MTEAKHKNVHAALVAAQMQMEPVKKGAINSAFKGKYADLADVFAGVMPALNANGLTLFHQIIRGDGYLDMRTSIVHAETDTRIECDVPLIVAKNDMQGMKSATTYAKRIGTESLAGIAPEDDDGNAAAKAPPPANEGKNAPTHEADQNITEEQYIELQDLIEKAGIPENAVLDAEKISALHFLPARRFTIVATKLRNTGANKVAAQ